MVPRVKFRRVGKKNVTKKIKRTREVFARWLRCNLIFQYFRIAGSKGCDKKKKKRERE